MADDMIPQDADEMLDQVVDATTDGEQEAGEVEQFDERVEAAVRHVAEEAEADVQAAEAAFAEADAQAVAAVLAESEVALAEPEVAPEQAVEPEPERKKRERRSKQARAAKATGREDEAVAPAAAKPAKKSSLGTGAWAGICCAALLAGLLIGRFVLGGGAAGGSSLHVSDTTSIEAAQLESTFATYTYNGETKSITVQQVIDGSGNATSYDNGDGTYKLPSAEIALSVARNEIVKSEMDARGITASDEDLEAFAQEQLGMTDFEAIASAYGVEVDQLKEQLSSAYRLKLLRDEVIDVEVPEQPTQPTAPEEGKEEKATKAYAKYILELAGDEWDSKEQKWVDETSAYATALADYEIKNNSATYAAAQDAYYVAYQQYATAQSEYSNQWTEFVNGLMVNASVAVGTLVM